MISLIFAVMRAGLAGALLSGAVGTATAIIVYAPDGAGALSFAGQVLSAGITLTIASLPIWLFGLILLGLPLLLVLTRLGMTDRRTAALTGAGLAAAVPVTVVLLGASTDVLKAALWLAPIGAVVGPVLRNRVLIAGT